jgi:hypothetical protein
MAVESRARRLGHQQMDVLGHDHVTVDAQGKAKAGLLQLFQEEIASRRVAQAGLAAIAAEGDEMRLLGLLEAAESARHG